MSNDDPIQPYIEKQKRLAEQLDIMIESHQHLPDKALYSPITHRDYLSLLLMLREVLIDS